MKKGQRFLIVQKFRLGWYWRLQSAIPPKVGDKLANGGQPYDNKKFCEKMASSVVSGVKELRCETKTMIVWEVKNFW